MPGNEDFELRYKRRQELGTAEVLYEASAHLVDAVAEYEGDPGRLAFVMLDVAADLSGYAGVKLAMKARMAEQEAIKQRQERTQPLEKGEDDPQDGALTFAALPPGATFRRLGDPLAGLYLKAGHHLAAPLDGGIVLRLAPLTPVNMLLATFADLPQQALFALNHDDTRWYVKFSDNECGAVPTGVSELDRYFVMGTGTQLIPTTPRQHPEDLDAIARIADGMPHREAQVSDGAGFPDVPSAQLRWRDSQYPQLDWTSAAWGLRTAPYWVIGAALMEHDYDCSQQQLAAMDARIAYFLAFPQVCRRCEGAGFNQLVGQTGPCPLCVRLSLCPRCRHRTLMGGERDGGKHTIWCQTCGWTEGRTQDPMPGLPQCLCTLRAGDPNDEHPTGAAE